MQYADTITITNRLDSDKFTMLLLALLISIAVYCAINILCDHLRMKKIELAIYLIEKGHNRIAAEKSKTTSKGTNVYHKKEGDVRNEGRNSEKRRSYYTSV